MHGNQPLHVLKSYLEACNVHFEVVDETLKVDKNNGEKLSVIIGTKTLIKDGVCEVGAKEIISPNPEVFLNALHTVTECAGYGKPNPVNRGEAPSSRINYKDQFEEVYLRHSVFRRSPNPKDETLLKYATIIEKVAKRAFRRYNWILEPMGFGADDLINIGRVHTVTFIHYYASAENKTDNIKLLTEYLKQRFSELAKLCHKKAENSTCLPANVKTLPVSNEEDTFTYYLNTMGDEDATEEDEEYVEGDYLLEISGNIQKLEIRRNGLMDLSLYVDGHLLTAHEISKLQTQVTDKTATITPVEVKEPVSKITPLKTMSAYQRRIAARKMLFAGLDKLSKEERNVALAYAVYSKDYEPDARIMAKKLCDELCCPKCKRKIVTGKFCVKCNLEAVPRYGVDYKSIKTQLTPQVVCAKCLKSSCDCMTGIKTVIIGNQSFQVKTKPATSIVYPDGGSLVQSMTSVPSETVSNPAPVTVPVKKEPVAVTRASFEEIKAAEKEMIDAFWKTLPEEIRCPRHNNGAGGMAPKSSFRPLIALRYDNGMPKRVRHTCYCGPCFRVYSRNKAQGN